MRDEYDDTPLREVILTHLKRRGGDHPNVLDGAAVCELDLLGHDGKGRGFPNNVSISARYGTRVHLFNHGSQPWPANWREDLGMTKGLKLKAAQ